MQTTLSSLKIIKFGMFAFHTVVFWSTVWFFDLLFRRGGSLFSQHLLLYCAQVLCIYAFRGYDLRQRRDVHQVVLSIFIGVLLAAIVLVPVFILFYKVNIPKNTIYILSASTFLSVSLFRAAASFYLLRHPFVKRFFVLGDRETWEPLVQEIARSLGGGVGVAAYINPTLPDETVVDATHPCSILVGDLQMSSVSEIRNWIKSAEAGGSSVEYLPQLAEESLGRIPLRLAATMKDYYKPSFEMTHMEPTQRVLDILVAIPGLIVTAALSLIIVPLIVLESGFPVIFRQPRIGLGGKPFMMHKFRTMRVHKRQKDATADDEASHITFVGRLLRKLRLDELPQLWDVLRGAMSIVGPRPEMRIYHQRCAERIPFYEYRLKLKPGITGWAQVNYKHTSTDEDYARKTEYDLYYIKNRTLLLDLQIILLTAETMLGMRGSR